MSPTVFDRHGTDRIAAWKQFRDTLETSDHPLEDVAELWSHAPFVSAYLDPYSPQQWPDPWQLILDLRLDDLAIALGMLYTIKLTQRFIKTKCEIHKLMIPGKSEVEYVLIVDDSHVLNHACRTVSDIEEIKHLDASIVWQQ
jgi:hypothetical protein